MSCLTKAKKYLSILILPALLLTAKSSTQAAPVTVMSSVSANGANYMYDFAITNNSTMNPDYNLVSVDFSFAAGTVIGMAMAPASNGAVTDPSGNFVEFTSDNVSGFPAGMTVDGFQLVSAMQFSSWPFTANFVDSTGSVLTAVNGTTSTAAAAVPEPATCGLLGGAVLLLFGFGRRPLRRA